MEKDSLMGMGFPFGEEGLPKVLGLAGGECCTML